MLLYYLFWMFMGFTKHFYIIFGTNLLTGGPAQNCFFCLFQYFEETEYQTESKRNETFGIVIFQPNMIQETWTLLQEAPEAVTRVEGALPGRAPYLVASSGTSSTGKRGTRRELLTILRAIPTCRLLICLQHIYNFWLLHAILSTVLDIIGLSYPLLYYFWD